MLTRDQRWFAGYTIACIAMAITGIMIMFTLTIGVPIMVIPFGAAFLFMLYYVGTLESEFVKEFGGVIYLSGTRPEAVKSGSAPEPAP